MGIAGVDMSPVLIDVDDLIQPFSFRSGGREPVAQLGAIDCLSPKRTEHGGTGSSVPQICRGAGERSLSAEDPAL